MIKFASHIGIKKNRYKFLASDGVHEAEVDLDGKVSLKMQNVNDVDFKIDHYVLNTGSPHFVKLVKNVADMDVVAEGRKIRYNKEFAEKGVNVNFIELLSDDEIFVRTYERGVENETLSCGTGVTASALISAHNDKGFNRVEVKTKGGKLDVEFEKMSDTAFADIWLSGPVNLVFTGEIQIKG